MTAATGSDGDNDPLTYSYEWVVNGSSVQSGASNILDSSYFVKEDVVEVIVIANDGAEDSSTILSLNYD